MPSINLVKSSKIVRSSRVMQLEGMFDITSEDTSTTQWKVDLELPEKWNIGAIVGPSGSGKTTIARALFEDHIAPEWEWDEDRSIVDGFPAGMPIKDIIKLISSVGFSSPPSWLRPFRVLSTGEQFRVSIARTLAEMGDLAVVDEFTSVVDRTVAQIGSAAVAKVVRKRGQKLIVLSCHYDILDWLEPDWIYLPHLNDIHFARYLQRPSITLRIQRVDHSAWNLFRRHHYMNTEINRSARCFCAFWEDIPVAFSAELNFPHPKMKDVRREHRTVCLPDYQGIGIGNSMSEFMGAMCRGLGYRWMSVTSHPGMIAYRNKSNSWRVVRKASLVAPTWKTSTIKAWKTQVGRLTASYEYVGSALNPEEAKQIWDGK